MPQPAGDRTAASEALKALLGHDILGLSGGCSDHQAKGKRPVYC